MNKKNILYCLSSTVFLMMLASNSTFAKEESSGETLLNIEEKSMEKNKIMTDESIAFSSEDLRKEVVMSLNNINNLVDRKQFVKHNIETYIPKKEDLENLKTLRIIGDGTVESFSTIEPVSFARNLETLHISRIALNDVENLSELKKLKSLSLPGTKITDLKFLKNLDNIEKLNISENNVVSLEPLSKLSKLTYLDARNNKIKKLSGLENLIKLENIDLSYNEIESVEQLNKLEQLKDLKLSVNPLKSLVGIGKKENLEIMIVDNNLLDSIDEISNFTNLRVLTFIDEPLSYEGKLPDQKDEKNIKDISALKNLINLEALSIRGNKISDISSLEKLTKLKYLHLYDNDIEGISALANLKNLVELNFSQNKVKNIDVIQNMPNLRVLFAYHNNIEDASKITTLDKLRIVNLSENNIADISNLKKQMELEHKESYVVDKQKIFKTIKIKVEDNHIIIDNFIKDMAGEFVKIDSTLSQNYEEDEESANNKAIKLYNDGILRLQEQGIVIKTLGEKNEKLEIIFPTKIADKINLVVPFFQKDAIKSELYESDFPEIFSPIVDNIYEQPPFKEGESYNQNYHFSGEINLEIINEKEKINIINEDLKNNNDKIAKQEDGARDDNITERSNNKIVIINKENNNNKIEKENDKRLITMASNSKKLDINKEDNKKKILSKTGVKKDEKTLVLIFMVIAIIFFRKKLNDNRVKFDYK